METSANESGRRHRYVRHRFNKPAFMLQPRDRDIIRLVSDHRVISSDDIALLIGGSPQGILRRLQRLYHHNYLDRPRSQRQLGNVPMIYALGQEGAELIARETGKKPVADWAEKNRQIRTHYLEHALMISRFQVALRHAAASTGTVRLERWLPDGAIRDAVWVEHRDRRERIPIAPDAFFMLGVGGENPGRIYAVLEADRGTMTVGRFTTKLRGCFAYWRSGQAQEHLGMRNFLVVTVTSSSERAVNLAQACTAVSDRGLRMFLFGCERDFLPAARSAVLEPIWRTPSDDIRHSLLE